MEIPTRCVKNEARSNMWEVPAERVPTLAATRNGKPRGTAEGTSKQQPRRIKHGGASFAPLSMVQGPSKYNCNFRRSLLHVEVHIKGILMILRCWGRNFALYLLLPQLETLLIPSLPPLSAKMAFICKDIFFFLILYSFVILDFNSTSSYSIRRFSRDFFASSFFHIIIHKDIRDTIHYTQNQMTFLHFWNRKPQKAGVSLVHRRCIFFNKECPNHLSALQDPSEIGVVPLY